MRQHKEEDWARWRGLVSEQVESGRSVATFCRERGLRDWQLYEWKKRLREAEAAPFVAVEVARSEAPTRPVPVQMFGSDTPKRNEKLAKRERILATI
jgi:hypothetical protein